LHVDKHAALVSIVRAAAEHVFTQTGSHLS